MPKLTYLSLETQQRMVWLYQNTDHTINSLSRQFQCSRSAVIRVLKRHGVRISKDSAGGHRGLPTPEEIEARKVVIRDGWDNHTERLRRGSSPEPYTVPLCTPVHRGRGQRDR